MTDFTIQGALKRLERLERTEKSLVKILIMISRL